MIAFHFYHKVIKGSELNLMFDTSLPMPRSFGISFSNQLDVDDNGYVGEYEFCLCIIIIAYSYVCLCT